jgi:ATP adenylyltransferase
MERLWTPWRMQYVGGEQPPGCVFCELPKSTDDAESLLLHRGERAFVLLNLYPYNSGHLMVAPYEHGGDFSALPAEIGSEILALSQHAAAVLKAEYGCDGFNLGMNLGRAAGAGVPDHLHVHLVPRWIGDGNFMSLTANTKVLPESLAQTYARLKKAW